MSYKPTNVVIRVADLSKRYALFQSPMDRVRQSVDLHVRRLLRRQQPIRRNEFDALKHVSFAVERGETVGIVGRNGSGKSTLLQLICGTLTPTSGEVEVHGRIAALLELGAGFNPDYTGRENVFLNAAILGLSRKEAEGKLGDILAFADIGQFIDQPVKTYSSGMFVRLAFATAINTDPDILIVDEALAVGDEAFQRKCFARLRQIQNDGATILFVSHSAQSVIELCDRAILLDDGELLMQGDPKAVTSQYQRLVHAPPEKADAIRADIRLLETESTQELPESINEGAMSKELVATTRQSGAVLLSHPDIALQFEAFEDSIRPESTITYSERGAKISNVRIVNSNNELCNILVQGQTYYYCYKVTFESRQRDVSFAMLLKTVTGLEISGEWSHLAGEGLSFEAGEAAEVRFPFTNRMLQGTYFANAGVFSHAEGDFVQLHRVIDAVMFKVAPYPEPQRYFGIVTSRDRNSTKHVEVQRVEAFSFPKRADQSL